MVSKGLINPPIMQIARVLNGLFTLTLESVDRKNRS